VHRVGIALRRQTRDATRLQQHQRRQAQKVAEHASEREKQEQLKIQAAREGHRAAVQRLRAASVAVQTTAKLVDAGAVEQVAARKRAVAELQASVAAVHGDMRKRADLYRCGNLRGCGIVLCCPVSLSQAFSPRHARTTL
jgi:phospholipase/lecithinase/hemolysin